MDILFYNNGEHFSKYINGDKKKKNSQYYFKGTSIYILH